MYDYFSIRFGSKCVAKRLQLLRQFAVVVDFTIESHCHLLIFVEYRLLSSCQVNNSEPAMPNANLTANLHPFSIRATVPEFAHYCRQTIPLYR